MSNTKLKPLYLMDIFREMTDEEHRLTVPELVEELQRRGVPFAAGVLAENDLDYPVAKALAAELLSVPPFAPVDGEALERARAWMVRCEQVVCCLSAFGPQNEGNRILRDEAEQKGLLTDIDALLREVAP